MHDKYRVASLGDAVAADVPTFRGALLPVQPMSTLLAPTVAAAAAAAAHRGDATSASKCRAIAVASARPQTRRRHLEQRWRRTDCRPGRDGTGIRFRKESDIFVLTKASAVSRYALNLRHVPVAHVPHSN